MKATDAGHAQAQACDISRALKTNSFNLSYGKTKESELSDLFEKLAFNNFNQKECDYWESSFSNKCPVVYAFKSRYFIRPLILDYLDISGDMYVKTTCGNKNCINPYHNSYKKMKASKTTLGDTRLIVTFASQGVPIKEIAKALKVHRSTIYRILSRERLPSGATSH